MSALAWLAEHYVLAVVYMLAGGLSLSLVVRAAVKPLETWRRPGDCPRCRGTGREPPR